MSDRVPERPPRPPSRRPLLFQMLGRETVKDLTLVVAAIPVIACLMYVPVLISGDGSWPRLVVLLVIGAAIWWALRVLLRGWVARGEREDETSGEAG